MDKDGFEADYIVVGAGTAGCVVATRLVKNGYRVRLIEQGADGKDPNIENARLPFLNKLWEDRNHIRDYPMMPRAVSPHRWPELMRGCTVGGSGAINVMIHTRGNAADFDNWAQMGNPGWSFADCLPYFKMSESYEGGETEFRGGSGPIEVRKSASSVYAEALELAAVEVGFHGPDWDLNGEQQQGGVGPYQFAYDRSFKRSSTASAYLRRIENNPNLRLMTHSVVARVTTETTSDGARATGVSVVDPASWIETPYSAKEGVVVCAGALESPKLLMLSGIGPGGKVRDLVGHVVADLPGVGQNLQDHVICPLILQGAKVPPPLDFLTEIGLYVQVHGGEELSYDRDGWPTVQYFMNAGIPERKLPWVADNYFGIYPSLSRPETKGSISLLSADPRTSPRIEMDYLTAGDDMDTLINALRLALVFSETKALSHLNVGVSEMMLPGHGMVRVGHDTPRDVWELYAHSYSRGLWHPVGTCSMGPEGEPGSVVDQTLKVHGVDGLSVCDASVFPKITCGNVNATVIMIAEKFCDAVD